jgi:hypothetical protein
MDPDLGGPKTCGSGGSGTLAKSVANLDTPLLYEDGVGGGARAVEHPHAPSHRHGYGGLEQPVVDGERYI